ncbi:MAG: hypothetical protein LV473_06210 [Nitrospira sp.]|nr:hypothetical protein [Nitrospira sp.]
MATWLEQNVVDLIGHALTIIGIVAAAATVILQLGRQHKSSLQLQRDNAREELKLRLHEMLTQKVRKLSTATTQTATYVRMIPFNVENFQRQLAQGLHPAPIKDRAQEFSRLHTEVSNALIELIYEFEAWSIAFPGIEVFQVALNAAIHDARERFTSLFTALLRVLPMDLTDNMPQGLPNPMVPPPITDHEYEQLMRLVEHYNEALYDIQSYIHDLTIESQNNLLSGLFERCVPLRQPIDPKSKVITTHPEKAGGLLRYFENETPWGKSKQAAEARAKARFGVS